MTIKKREAEKFLKSHNIEYETIYPTGFVKLNGGLQHISKIKKIFDDMVIEKNPEHEVIIVDVGEIIINGPEEGFNFEIPRDTSRPLIDLTKSVDDFRSLPIVDESPKKRGRKPRER